MFGFGHCSLGYFMTSAHVVTALEIVSAASALTSAFYGLKAASYEPRPVWDDHPELTPNNMEMHNFGWVNALGAANFWAGRAGKKCAVFSIISALAIVLALIIKFHYS